MAADRWREFDLLREAAPADLVASAALVQQLNQSTAELLKVCGLEECSAGAPAAEVLFYDAVGYQQFFIGDPEQAEPPAGAYAGAAALPLGDLCEYEMKRLEDAKPQTEVLHVLSLQAASIAGIVGCPVRALRSMGRCSASGDKANNRSSNGSPSLRRAPPCSVPLRRLPPCSPALRMAPPCSPPLRGLPPGSSALQMCSPSLRRASPAAFAGREISAWSPAGTRAFLHRGLEDKAAARREQAEQHLRRARQEPHVVPGRNQCRDCRDTLEQRVQAARG